MRCAVLASLGLIAGVAVAGGCGGDGSDETPTPRPADDATETPALSPTFEEFESDSLGFRFEIPEGWAHEAVPSEVGDETIVSESFSATTPIDGEPSTISVLRTPAGGQTVEEVLRTEEPIAIQEDDLVVAGHDAVRVDFTAVKQGVWLAFSQVFVVIEDTLWTLTLVVEVGNQDTFLPIFEHVYNSFQPT